MDVFQDPETVIKRFSEGGREIIGKGFVFHDGTQVLALGGQRLISNLDRFSFLEEGAVVGDGRLKGACAVTLQAARNVVQVVLLFKVLEGSFSVVNFKGGGQR